MIEFFGIKIGDLLDSIDTENLEIFDPTSDIISFVEKTCDNNRIRFQCDSCPKSYNCRRSFLRHADYHQGRYTCGICMQKCTSKSTLDIHYMRHHTADVDEDAKNNKENVTKTHIWCPLCKKFVRKSFLQFHLRRSHVNEKRVKNLHTLLKLMESDNNARVFKCTICDKSYDNYSSLKTHRNTHSDKFVCQICNKQNASLTALRRHFKSHKIDCDQDNLEFDENYIFCDICMKYVNKIRMDYHQKTVHDKKFPMCDYCKRTFQTKAVRYF